ncbi:FAD synthase [Candidatus Woesearchaeota archaeon]|nr:FAD synthase [Candidatus Woesearchaeota archaeon]
MVFGTFDILHKGHLDFFRQAKRHGDFLVAVVGRDKTVEKIKGRKPVNNEHQRLLEVYHVPEVDFAALGEKDDPYRIIEEQKPDVICLGYDQNSYTKNLEKELKKRKIKAEIVRLKPYEEHKYKSSKINSC